MTLHRLSRKISTALELEIKAMRTEGLFSSYPPMATANITSKPKPVYKLPDLSTLQINASPYTRNTSRASRNSFNQEYGVLLIVQMRTLADNDLFDSLIDMVNDLDDLLADRYLEIEGRKVTWSGSDANPIYDLEEAFENKVFYGLLQINYQAFVN